MTPFSNLDQPSTFLFSRDTSIHRYLSVRLVYDFLLDQHSPTSRQPVMFLFSKGNLQHFSPCQQLPSLVLAHSCNFVAATIKHVVYSYRPAKSMDGPFQQPIEYIELRNSKFKMTKLSHIPYLSMGSLPIIFQKKKIIIFTVYNFYDSVPSNVKSLSYLKNQNQRSLLIL